MSYIKKIIFCLLFVSVTHSASAAYISSGIAENGVVYITIEGTIELNDGSVFARIVQDLKSANIQPQLVVVNSTGGSVYAGIQISQIILANKLSTAIPYNCECLSSCFTIFASGIQKIADRTSRIGVHRASENFQDTDYARSASINLITYYEYLKVPETIIYKMLRTVPGDMHYLTVQEKDLLAVSVINTVQAQKYLNDNRVQTQVSTPSKPDRKTARQLNEKGIIYIRNGRYYEAIQVLEQSKAIYSTDAEVLGNLGYAYSMVNDFAKSQDNLTLSLKIMPTRGATWNNLGLTLASQQNVEWATKCFINYWNYSKNKKAATNQFFYWEENYPNTYLALASQSARQALGIYQPVP